MLCSMTGYGDASYQSDDLQVAVELRAVNNRYLKVTLAPANRTISLKPSLRKWSAAPFAAAPYKSNTLPAEVFPPGLPD